jgi:hypothetical protein
VSTNLQTLRAAVCTAVGTAKSYAGDRDPFQSTFGSSERSAQSPADVDTDDTAKWLADHTPNEAVHGEADEWAEQAADVAAVLPANAGAF